MLITQKIYKHYTNIYLGTVIDNHGCVMIAALWMISHKQEAHKPQGIPYALYRIRWNIGGTLIGRIAKILYFADLILAVDARGYDSNTLVYT